MVTHGRGLADNIFCAILRTLLPEQALCQTSRTLQLPGGDRRAWEEAVRGLERCAQRLARRRALDSDAGATDEATAPAMQLLSCLADSLRIHAARERHCSCSASPMSLLS